MELEGAREQDKVINLLASFNEEVIVVFKVSARGICVLTGGGGGEWGVFDIDRGLGLLGIPSLSAAPSMPV